MFWVILFSVPAGLLMIGVGVRKYVCFRRKDCCGKGCGCLFPAKKNGM